MFSPLAFTVQPALLVTGLLILFYSEGIPKTRRDQINMMLVSAGIFLFYFSFIYPAVKYIGGWTLVSQEGVLIATILFVIMFSLILVLFFFGIYIDSRKKNDDLKEKFANLDDGTKLELFLCMGSYSVFIIAYNSSKQGKPMLTAISFIMLFIAYCSNYAQRRNNLPLRLKNKFLLWMFVWIWVLANFLCIIFNWYPFQGGLNGLTSNLIIAPLAEEIMFTVLPCLFISKFSRNPRQITAFVIIVSAIFATAHYMQYINTDIGAIFLFILLAEHACNVYIFVLTGNIPVLILLHGSSNLFDLLLPRLFGCDYYGCSFTQIRSFSLGIYLSTVIYFIIAGLIILKSKTILKPIRIIENIKSFMSIFP